MDIRILEEIGLTKTEIKIYLALLKQGQSTTTPIVRGAHIHASKVYEFLDKLIQKGLVSYVVKSNKRHFSASSPECLKELLREKREKINIEEKKLNRILPSLLALQTKKDDRINAEIYEGLRGIKSVYEKILTTLNEGDTQYIIGAPKLANEKIEGFLLEWHKRRIKKRIRCAYIYDSDARKYGSVRKTMRYTHVRYLPNHIVSPVWIEVFKDYVAIGHIRGNDAILFLIQDEEIARKHLDYFELIWKQSEK